MIFANLCIIFIDTERPHKIHFKVIGLVYPSSRIQSHFFSQLLLPRARPAVHTQKIQPSLHQKLGLDFPIPIRLHACRSKFMSNVGWILNIVVCNIHYLVLLNVIWHHYLTQDCILTLYGYVPISRDIDIEKWILKIQLNFISWKMVLEGIYFVIIFGIRTIIQ